MPIDIDTNNCEMQAHSTSIITKKIYTTNCCQDHTARFLREANIVRYLIPELNNQKILSNII